MPWSKDKRRPHKRKRTLLKKNTPPVPTWLASKLEAADVIVGADECGWGCVAGPIVVAACILPKDYSGPKLRDSKRYSSERTREQAEQLVKQHALRHVVVPVSAFTVAQFGPAEALDYAYNTAITAVLEDTEFSNPLIVIDGARKVPSLELKHYALPKGDDRIQAIAAASIIGKCWRDRYMTDLENHYPDFHFSVHKGYPTGAHYAEMRRFGVTPEHRKNIEYVREMLEKVGTYRHGS